MASARDSVEWVSRPPRAHGDARGPDDRGTTALHHAGFCHDPDNAVRALGVPRGGRVLVVDAYGGSDTALAHLINSPAAVRVLALADAPGVESLLALKSAAVACLPRMDALRLLGLLRASRTERIDAYLGVRDALSDEARVFWDRHRGNLAAGLYSTSAEAELGRLLRNLLWNNLASDEYRTLLYGSPEDRLRVFDERIAGSGFWRGALRLCALRGAIGRPADRTVDPLGGADPVAALRRMVAVGLWSTPLWARAFCNDYGMLAVLPTYLQPDGYEEVRRHLDRLDPHVDGIDAALDAAAVALYDGVDLGSLPDHLDPAGLQQVLHRFGRLVRPAGALAFTTLRVHALATPAPRGFVYDLERESDGAERDRAPMSGRRRVLRRV